MVYNCSVKTCNEKFIKGGKLTFHSLPRDPHLRRKWCEIIEREGNTPTNHSKLCSKHFREEDFEINFCQIKLKRGVVPTIFTQNENTAPPKPQPLEQMTSTSLPTTQKKLTIEVTSISNINFGNSDNNEEVQINKDNNEAVADNKSKPCQSFTLNFKIVNNNIENSGDSKDVQGTNNPSCGKDIHSEDNEGIIKRPKIIGRKSYVEDYNLCDMSSPAEAGEFYQIATKEVKEKSKMVKLLRQRSKLLECRISCLKSTLKFYQENAVLSENALQHPKNVQKRPPIIMENEPRFEMESESNLLMTNATPTAMTVEVDPTNFISSIPGTSDQMEQDSSMMEQDVHSAKRCKVNPVEEPQPDSSKIKEEPIDTDIDEQDISSASVIQEQRHFSKGASSTSNLDGCFFQPPALIEEQVSSEEKL